ncbi:MAG: hypothetical protein HQM04_02710 [Magnetococcales bacterium]|nr:hypothetical protein [Magnetococcales bacterium]MBF0113933.1 hypothetical protein [Magnetococcales bacterium]
MCVEWNITSVFAEYGLSAEYFDLEYAGELSGLVINSAPWYTVRPPAWVQKSQQIDALIRYLHIYIDSGLPPVIGLPGHAVVAFGYVCSDQRLVHRAGKIIPASDFVEGLTINDDNVSPYQKIFRQEREPECWPYGNCLESVDGFIAPLPEKVFLSVDQAERATEVIMARHIDEASLGDSQLVRRMFCTSSKNYKLFRGSEEGEVTRTVVGQPLPHFLWVTEFIPVTQWQNRDKGKVVCMEIVLDATAGMKDTNPFLWIRAPFGAKFNMQRMHGSGSVQSYGTALEPIRSFRGNHVPF